MKFKEIKGHNEFRKGQRITCVANDRGSSIRSDVKLTNNKVYTVLDTEVFGIGTYKRITVFVENDDGIVEKYSSKRFKIDREAVLAELLD